MQFFNQKIWKRNCLFLLLDSEIEETFAHNIWTNNWINVMGFNLSLLVSNATCLPKTSSTWSQFTRCCGISVRLLMSVINSCIEFKINKCRVTWPIWSAASDVSDLEINIARDGVVPIQSVERNSNNYI